MEEFYTAGAVLLWIIIGAIGLVVAGIILCLIAFAALNIACSIKEHSRKRKLKRRLRPRKEADDA